MSFKNKTNQAKSSSKHYQDNKEKIKARARVFSKQAKQRNREFVNEYLKTHPCVDCGEKNIIVLEFDHVRGEKCGNVTDGIKNFWSLNKLKKEIEKCDIRCANCHRIITHKRRNNIASE